MCIVSIYDHFHWNAIYIKSNSYYLFMYDKINQNIKFKSLLVVVDI